MTWFHRFVLFSILVDMIIVYTRCFVMIWLEKQLWSRREIYRVQIAYFNMIKYVFILHVHQIYAVVFKLLLVEKKVDGSEKQPDDSEI